MKFLVVLSALVAFSAGQVFYGGYPGWNSGYLPYSYPTAYSGYPAYTPYAALPVPAHVAAPVVSVPVSSQYHAQDELGQFTFATHGDNQARIETKTLDGTVSGSYSYVDPTGKVVSVNYLADDNGFRVIGANNLPVAPALPAVPELKGPEPVQDTPEVVAARAEFQKAFAEAKAAADAAPETVVSRKRRQAVLINPWAAPVLAKSTLKYNVYEPVDAATPADTKKIELKEKEQEITVPIASPIAYHALPVASHIAYHHAPIAYHSQYSLPYYGHQW